MPASFERQRVSPSELPIDQLRMRRQFFGRARSYSDGRQEDKDADNDSYETQGAYRTRKWSRYQIKKTVAFCFSGLLEYSLRALRPLSSRSEPAQGFLNMGRHDDMAAGMDSLLHIGKPGPAQRFRRPRLIFQWRNPVESTSTHKNRRAQKAASWLKTPIPFRDAFATHAGSRFRPVARRALLRWRGHRRLQLLRDPGNKNSDDPIPGEGEERCDIAGTFRST